MKTSSRHKLVEVFNKSVKVGENSSGTYVIFHDVNHSGKNNHTMSGKFAVIQNENDKNLDVRFYVLTEFQLANWFLGNIGGSTSRFPYPSDCICSSSKPVKVGGFKIPISNGFHAYFIIDNRHSSSKPKEVKISITEEWDEDVSSLDVVTTIPPHDKSLKQDVERLIRHALGDLKIITPYIDMSLVSELLQRNGDDVHIEIITRSRNDFTEKGVKEAFDHISKALDKNHKINEHIHSPVIIRDGLEALVSSADLTDDSLLGQFNTGVIVSEPAIINKLLEYFKTTWQKSSFN